jgi:hypothetical protein
MSFIKIRNLNRRRHRNASMGGSTRCGELSCGRAVLQSLLTQQYTHSRWLGHVWGTCTPKHVLNRLHSVSSAEEKHACRQHILYLHRRKYKSTLLYSHLKKISLFQTLVSLRPSEICQNINFPRFRCPSECIFSLPDQVCSYCVHPSAIHRFRQASYSFPVSINNFSTLRW